MIWLVLVLLAPTAVLLADKDSFLPLSESSFSDMRCVPYAYGDFNADKFVDVFCVSNEGRQVEIWLARENKEPLFERSKIFSLVKNETSIIKSIVPGDFNGDSIMDLLITYSNTATNKLSCSMFLGNKQSKYTNDLEAEIDLGLVLDDQPFVADFNGDGKLDVLVITSEATKPLFFSFELNGTLDNQTGLEFQLEDSLLVGYAQSISDITGDLSADLCLTTKKAQSDEMLFQILELNSLSNQYVYKESYVPPEPSSGFIYGQSLFADFDSDGIIEHLLPVCKDIKCFKSAIYVRKNAKWIELPIKFDSFGFVPPQDVSEFWWHSSSIRVIAGDYNLNGYVDLLAVLRNNNKTSSPRQSGKSLEQNAILLENIPYTNSSTTVDEFTRTFSIDTKISHLFAHDNVVQASFFDLYDNGYLDILIVLKDSSSEEKDAYKLIALENKYEDDVYFLKVMVIPGRCSVNRCPYQSLPYGLNFPGAMIKMETTSYEYERVVLYAAQLSQSSHMALQLPYVIFGLGSTPNFVELLTVSIQSVTTNKNIRGFAKEWHQIIPNSQLVISPEPRYYPNNWKLQLFITPSKNILMTGVALGVTMICLIVMIGVLQFKERKLDEKERKLESQRFHFDGL